MGSAKDLSNGSDLSFTVNETDTLKQCCCREWPLMTSSEHLSGTTLHRLEGPCYQLSTSSTEVFPARTSVLQDLERVWKDSEAAYSSRLSGLQKKLERLSYFLKTSLQSGQEDFRVFASSWPRWGMICDGRFSAPQALEPVTKGIDGSYLPTPTACVYGSNTSKNSTNKRLGLMQLAQKGMLPTPCARDWKDTGAPSEMRRKSPSLAAMVGGSLNPQLVEEIMGYKIGWTDLDLSVTRWFHSKSKRRLKN